MSEHDNELPVREFFENDGAIGLIARIDRQEGNIVKEFEDKLDISGKTLTGLLGEALDADLIEEVGIRPGDPGRAKPYQLTDRGKAVQTLLRGKGLDDVHREYMARKEEMEAAVEDIQTVIREENWHKSTLQEDFWTATPDLSEEEKDRFRQEIEDIDEPPREPDVEDPRLMDDELVDVVSDDSEDNETVDDDSEDTEDKGEPSETWGSDPPEAEE